MEKTAANKVPFFSEEKDRQMDQQLRDAFGTPEGRARRKTGIRRFFCIMLALMVFMTVVN